MHSVRQVMVLLLSERTIFGHFAGKMELASQV